MVPALEREGAGGDNSAPRQLAVEAYPHEAAWPQQLEQDPPARLHVGEVMQHAAGIDQVEASADRFELENIGLGVLDLARRCGRRLPFRVAKAAEAEIDGQDARGLVFMRHLDRMPAGAAPGHEDVDAVGITQRTEGSRRKLIAE